MQCATYEASEKRYFVAWWAPLQAPSAPGSRTAAKGECGAWRARQSIESSSALY